MEDRDGRSQEEFGHLTLTPLNSSQEQEDEIWTSVDLTGKQGEGQPNQNPNGDQNDPNDDSDKENFWWKRYLGMSLAVLASFIFSLGVLIVKYLKNYHPSSIAIWRFQGILLPSIAIILQSTVVRKNEEHIFQQILPPPWCHSEMVKINIFLFLRAFTGCSSAILQYYSLKYLDMSDSTVIAFSSPVFVTFLAYCFLKEECGVINIMAALMALLGVVVIARPPFITGAESLDVKLAIGAGLAFGSMMFENFVFLTLRVLKKVHYAVIGLFYGIYGTIESAILAAIIGTHFQLPESSWDWFLAVFVAGVSFFGQVCMSLALRFEEAGIVALCRTFEVIFSFIWQFVFFGVTPTLFSILGSLIIMTAVFIIFFRKYLTNLPTDHPRRSRFCIFLR